MTVCFGCAVHSSIEMDSTCVHVSPCGFSEGSSHTNGVSDAGCPSSPGMLLSGISPKAG